MALLDKPPSSRWTIKEVKGRLVVIDNETGAPPLSAAERMAVWDAQAGPVPRTVPISPPDDGKIPQPELLPWDDKPAAQSHPARSSRPRKTPNPWIDAPQNRQPVPPARSKAQTQTTNTPPSMSGKQFTTSAAWDKKGPRDIRLDDKSQQYLSKMLMIALVVLFLAEIYIWSNGVGDGLFVHVMLIIILWPRRADIGGRLIDHLMDHDKKSQL